MGVFSEVTCERCGYSAQTVAGRDHGFEVELQTVACTECRALHDVVVRSWTDGEPSPLGRRARVRCPEDAKHHVRKWSRRGPCPRCGAAVVVEAVGDWD